MSMSNRPVSAARKVLLVSETLGTPATERPWRDYGIALLEILKETGAEVTLVAERAFGFEPGSSDEAERSAAVHRYLSAGRYHPPLVYGGAPARLLARHAPAILRRIADRQHRTGIARDTDFPNICPIQVPDGLGWLRLVDRFKTPRRFYSSARLRAVHGTGTPELDGAGYDLVIMDGLLPVRIGNATGRVVTMVHDASELVSPAAPRSHRLSAGAGLLAAAGNGGSALFATEAARRRFGTWWGGRAADAARLGPLASSRIRDLVRTGPARSTYLAALRKETERLAFLRGLTGRGMVERLVREITRAEPPRASGPDLPVIVIQWPAGESVDPLRRVAASLAGAATLVATGPEEPPPGPRIRPSTAGDFAAPSGLHLAGKLPEADRLALIGAAALHVLPSRSPGGASLLEAMALGTPVLCADLPDNREWAGDEVSYFDPAVRDGMAGSIRRALASRRDVDRIALLARSDAARESAVEILRGLLSGR